MQKQGIHQSEWDWVGSNFDYTIENTGTLEELNAEIDTTIHQLPNHQPSNEDA